MQRLRQARFLARLVLAWFALSLGIAAASPVVQGESPVMVCSGGAMKLLDGAGDERTAGAQSLDCPLCASAAPPPRGIEGGAAGNGGAGTARSDLPAPPRPCAAVRPPARGPPPTTTA